MEKATFAAGCFWGIEVEFRNVPGVSSAIVGYTGGTVERPTYEQVCTGATGHTEAVEVEFDPGEVTYEALLEKFWEIHDPTQVDRQGPDVGSQYRSGVFFHSPEQEAAATSSRQRRQAALSKPIATSIEPAVQFWPAEEYHQRYLERRGLATCRV